MADREVREPARGVDPRGVRFTAAMTSVVLAVGLVAESPRVLLAQAFLFGLCAVFGLQLNPYGVAYRRTLQSRLPPPAGMESEGPLRFSQGVGCAFAVVGAVGYATGSVALGTTATALALAAALLNAVFGVCVGCHLYVAVARVRRRASLT
ncbi:DUF4395 domain-containing protein [Umezawaea sp.]|uniref:DUF4395 domain-containing protein n=1 Tax=Umezawaea sp. TaxID=1955258 RepID=UPI002ED5E37F